MNVAIMVCGHFRNFHISEGYWKHFLANNKCDVFISTWEDHGNRSQTEWIDSQENKIDFKRITDIIQPKSYLIENVHEKNKTFTLRKNNNSLWFLIAKNSVESYDFSTYIVSQLYKIKTCFDLVESYAKENNKKYDLVFKIRADTFPDDFNLERYNIIKGHLDNNVLFCYNGANHRHYGGGGGCLTCQEEYLQQKRVHHDHTNDICDYFNYGNYNVMKKLSEIYDHKDEIYERMENHNLAIWHPNDKNVIFQPETNKYFVTWGFHIAKKYKCIYPEKFIREHLRNNWILNDHFCSFIPRKFDTFSYSLRQCNHVDFHAYKKYEYDDRKIKFL